MLIEARFANHRSIRSEQVLSLEAASGPKDDERRREIPGYRGQLLPAAAIYGANASGKTNVLRAFEFMRSAVIESHRSWPPDGGVPRSPFAFDDARQEPSVFEVLFVADGVRYQYGFAASDSAFEEEWLYAWPHGRKQMWFEREGQDFRFGGKLGGEKKLVEQVTRPNSLFLSASVQLGQAQFQPVHGWFEALVFRGQHKRLGPDDFKDSPHTFALATDTLAASLEEEPLDQRLSGMRKRFRRVLDLLKEADIGISNVRLEDGETQEDASFFLQHGTPASDSWLSIKEESEGTKALFLLGPFILDALESGGVLCVDELESSLHPRLAAELISKFNDPETNPRNAQLIFTTHDTQLLGTQLGNRPLRRDQVWLTEKDRDGATSLYPLSDYKPRKDENLERGYLQGRYGAVPYLGELIAPMDP
ncbi:MAG: ATP-binding protein [Acidobacteriota bacterium]